MDHSIAQAFQHAEAGVDLGDFDEFARLVRQRDQALAISELPG